MIRRSLAACLCLILPAPAWPATYRLDDSTSQVSPPVADWQWLPLSSRDSVHLLEMNVVVRVRLDTRGWDGRVGRIFMVLGPETGTGIAATWQGQGRLLGGRLVAGERALVYDGRVTGPVLEDTLRVRLTTDSRVAPNASRRLEFRFELESP